jgi:hypothetical protein
VECNQYSSIVWFVYNGSDFVCMGGTSIMVPGFAPTTNTAPLPAILVSSVLNDVAAALGCPAQEFAAHWQQRVSRRGAAHLEANLAGIAADMGVPVTPRAVFRAAALMRAGSGPTQ